MNIVLRERFGGGSFVLVWCKAPEIDAEQDLERRGFLFATKSMLRVGLGCLRVPVWVVGASSAGGERKSVSKVHGFEVIFRCFAVVFGLNIPSV